MKQYLGIILSTSYALTIRGLAEFNIIEINSISYLIVSPMIMGFIPFFLKNQSFIKNDFKIIIYPLISVLLFLIIAVINQWEDLICFFIIGIPYIIFSTALSLLLRQVFKNKDDGISKNALPILLLPLLFGAIEKQFPKINTLHLISNEIQIDCDKQIVWNNLFSVPDLTHENYKGILNYLGVPRPLFSNYDSISNTRLGYFEDNIVLFETVTLRKELEKLKFKINVQNSQFSNSPTLRHILKNKNIEFDNIQYEIISFGKNKTKLKLSTKFVLNSNLSFYGKFWSEMIINEFEINLLTSLKRVIENSNVANMP